MPPCEKKKNGDSITHLFVYDLTKDSDEPCYESDFYGVAASSVGMVGFCGIHFRFGAGICIQKDSEGKGQLCLLATAKNIIGVGGNTLETNIWKPDL